MNVPGFDFHSLRGKPQRYAMNANGLLRITFESKDGNAFKVDLVNYHEGMTMAETIHVTKPRQMLPVHPGIILRDDVLPALNISVSQAARELGLSRQTLHRILAGQLGVSTETALRLGKWCGNGAALWARLQQAYDLWHVGRELAVALAAVPSRIAA